ncbi:hypothetical protein CC2G_007228 [Coprinopsis cinerea AmutBmut pab1-1]|nr:hypothetical protein CC2G_007228 [Coprinopsis cinerea AmutBmut pab1-1]
MVPITFEYFGMSQKWLQFFDRFWRRHFIPPTKDHPRDHQTELRFAVEAPMAHALSAGMGEILLFAMDYSVDQKSDGLFLYHWQLHNDIWLQDSGRGKSAVAWEMHFIWT